jgi:CRP-like cAMP-binding protein
MSDIDGAAPRQPAELAARAHALTGRMATELRELIAAERVGRIDYERQVQESRKREKQYLKVLATLEGTTPKVGRPTQAAKAKQAAAKYASPDAVARALAVLRASGGPMTVVQVQEAMGVGSRETARKALERLREQGEARRAGVVKSPNGRTPSHTYAAMPKGGDNGGA